MSENVCPQCGAPIQPGATECKYCGEKLVQQQVNQQFSQPMQPQYSQPVQQYVQPQPQVIIQQAVPQPVYVTPIDPTWPVKNKTVAGLLGIFLGGLGIHKFYMGKIGLGILYLLFCWTYIPGIVGFIEGVMYLCSSNQDFQVKNHVRIG